MLGGVQFETRGVGPVPYLNILGGTSQKKHPVDGHHPDPAEGVGDNSNHGDGHGAQSSGALQAIA